MIIYSSLPSRRGREKCLCDLSSKIGVQRWIRHTIFRAMVSACVPNCELGITGAFGQTNAWNGFGSSVNNDRPSLFLRMES